MFIFYCDILLDSKGSEEDIGFTVEYLIIFSKYFFGSIKT